jgi:hypothetical protein
MEVITTYMGCASARRTAESIILFSIDVRLSPMGGDAKGFMIQFINGSLGISPGMEQRVETSQPQLSSTERMACPIRGDMGGREPFIWGSKVAIRRR